MGSQFFITKDEMGGNIMKVHTKFEADKEKLKKLKDLLQDEVDKKENKNDKSGSICYYSRGLEYLCKIFFELVKEHEESKKPGGKSDSGAIKAACKITYEKTLAKYHNMASRMVIKSVPMMSPYKEILLTNLGKGEKDKDDEVTAEMKAFEVPLREYLIFCGEALDFQCMTI